MRRFILAVLACVASALYFAVAQAAQVATTNGILTIEIEDAGSDAGIFSVRTGAAHPFPNQRVIFPVGTSYTTLIDFTAQQVYTNSGGTPSGNIPAGFTSLSMQTAPATAVVTVIPNGYRATYTLPNWTMVQDVVIAGTTLADTSVRETTTVTNTSAATRSYGLRYMWDWEIDGSDNALFRTRNPDTPFTATFAGFTNPAFQAFEETNTPTPLFSIFATVSGGTSLSPPPTAPDRLAYTSWSAAVGSPWDFPISGSGADSSTEHYWGFTAPLTLAAAASTSFTEYITTIPSAIGVGPLVSVAIPTLTDWGLIVLAALLGGAALVSLRRRGAI